MNRKSFIQQCMIQSLPKIMEAPDRETGARAIERHIKGAEAMWERLCERGYGDTKQRELGPAESHYKALQGDQKRWFDAFWDAFDHKHSREGAAKSWRKLNPDERLAQIITTAAGMDKRHYEQNPDKTRKMAQGWLTDRRWEDYDVEQVQQERKESRVNMEKARLDAELRSLMNLNRDGALDDQVARVREKLDELQRQGQ